MGLSKWFSQFKGSKKDVVGTTLSDIIRGIQFCVNSSTEIMEQHYPTSLQKYFDEDGNPIIKKININENYSVDLPLICLTSHHSLMLDEMKVNMNVTIKDLDLKKASAKLLQDEEDFTITRSSFSVDLGTPVKESKGDTNVKIEMRFKACEPPEAVFRVLEKYNNSITPQISEM